MGYFFRKPVNHDVWILKRDLRRVNNEQNVFGGIPRVKLLNAGQSIPEATKQSLLDAVSKPS
jgi:hypothetical protein